MNLKSIFQQDEYRRIRQAENFAMSFMSREMRDARDQAWKTREAFLRGSEDERRAWAESWFGQTLPEAGKKNWPVSMVIEYHVWIANFCDTLAENQQQKFRKGFIPLTHVRSEIVCGHWRGPMPSRHPRRKPIPEPEQGPAVFGARVLRALPERRCLPGAHHGGPLRPASHVREVRRGLDLPSPGEPPGLLLRALRATTFIRALAQCFRTRRTPLRVWFYAIYLFVTTRHGVSARNCNAGRRDLQNRVADGHANPEADRQG